MMEETLAGRIVVPMGLYGHADYPQGARAATNDGDESTPVKQMLDALHFRKIDLAHEILVVRVDGYVGASTAREIAYALFNYKRVRYRDFDPTQVFTFTVIETGRPSGETQPSSLNPQP